MHLSRWYLATLSAVSLAAGQTQTCYWPSGLEGPRLQACPVGSGNEAAACCFNSDYCMTNGLCLSPNEGTWYRGGCTDKDFRQTGCPKYCDTSDILGGTTVRRATVWACTSRLFACTSLENCSKQNFTVGAYRAMMNAALSTDLANSATTATGSTTSGSTGASSTASGDATDSTCPATENRISTGAAVGIGAGIGLPLAIAVGALTLMLMREKKRSREAQASNQQPGNGQQPGLNQPYTSTPPHGGKPEGHLVPNEASGHAMTHELADTQGRHELAH
ncbi:hypothetical protein CGCSCA4_v001490 [Colletotrichum siamense]|uniref:Uncharacterized protein n=1 Tax=Colletotrichum siamense TaxID=690259 RepID=A0A9P5F3G1_COLSI|nr:hypothetical protein CGCSCA4_v001490 [Colletotrichum siamense]KAF4865321.1 hypothetical protein CGCSCA2_v001482 [Colletotrichum siamense]